MLLSTLDSVNFHIPAALFCLTFLHGFFNAIAFWVIDTHARAWLLGRGGDNELALSDATSVCLHTLPSHLSSQPPFLSAADSSNSSGKYMEDYACSSNSEHSCSDSSQNSDLQSQENENDKTR